MNCSLRYYTSPHRINSISVEQLRLLSEFAINENVEKISNLDFLPLDFILLVSVARKCPNLVNGQTSEDNRIEHYILSGAREILSLYYKFNGKKLLYSTNIGDIVNENDKISIDYFHYFLSNGLGLGPFDRNKHFLTPFRNISKVPYSTLLHISSGRVDKSIHIPFYSNIDAFNNLAEAKSTANKALNVELDLISKCGRIAIETSGGIDSSIIASAAASIRHKEEGAVGIAAYYPYYEFRYERLFRDCLKHYCELEIIETEGTALLPFSKLFEIQSHSEPAWHSTGYGLAISLYEVAKKKKAASLLSGHSADYIFCMPQNQHPKIINSNSGTNLFKGMLVETLYSYASELLEQTFNDKNYFGDSSAWSLQAFEPSYFSKHTSNNYKKFFRGSPFMTPNFLGAAQYISTYLKKDGWSQKPMAYYMFGNLLPKEIWARKGKLDHQGLSYRGLRCHLSDIVRLIEISSGFLEYIGVDVKKTHQHIRKVITNKVELSPMFYGVLACAIWFYSFNRSNTARIK